eukprot:TRINITY_DN12763_c0_g1_i2.p1 TRINITY_DN12763_c0_g1~~TRINITY_DN12763_c0_g1_i2.p1  ORF type:complete len:303 (+),score=48.32 TRINITY_DN12763_c0_g1_i2:29-937(+)
MVRDSPVLVALKGVLAGTANCVAITPTNPLDVLKIRFQTQGEGVRGKEKTYPSVIKGAQIIYKTEGVSGLFKGWSVSCLRELTFSSARIGLYEPIKHMFSDGSAHTSLRVKIQSGLVSGAIAAAVFNPTDLLKVRFQADRSTTKESRRYRGIYHAFSTIWRTEGLVNGLYKGVGTTMLRASLLTSAQLGTYDHTKHMLIGLMHWKDDLVTHTTSSMASGVATALATNPVDVARTRIMNEVVMEGVPRTYTNPFSTMWRIAAQEGPLGLYKGFVPCYIRMGTTTTIVFIVYEQLRKLCGIPGL